MTSIQDYAAVTGEDVIDRLRQLARPLRGIKVVHVNSTYVGGGVAEILAKLVPLQKDLGLDVRWEVILGEERFFQITKSFHNALQGIPAPTGGCVFQSAAEPSVVLTDTQLASINVEAVGEHAFPQEMRTVGNIDFNQDLLTQVFTQYQGRIIKAFAKVGDTVKKGEPLLPSRAQICFRQNRLLSLRPGCWISTQRPWIGYVISSNRTLLRKKITEQWISDQQAPEGRIQSGSRRCHGIRQDRRRNGPHCERAEGRCNAYRLFPNHRPGHGKDAAPGLFGAAGNPPPVYIAGRYIDHVDDCECSRESREPTPTVSRNWSSWACCWLRGK